MKRRNRTTPTIIRIMGGATPGKTSLSALLTVEALEAFFRSLHSIPCPGGPTCGPSAPTNELRPTSQTEEPVNTCGPGNAGTAPEENERDQRRDQIIRAMCMTKRHDYGMPTYEAESGAGWLLGVGMSPNEKRDLYAEMAQLYNHHIAPVLKELDTMSRLRDQANASLNISVEQTMVQKRQIDKLQTANKLLGDTLTTSGMNNMGWMDAVQRIATKLRLKPETPIEIILDTIEQHMKPVYGHSPLIMATRMYQGMEALREKEHREKEMLRNGLLAINGLFGIGLPPTGTPGVEETTQVVIDEIRKLQQHVEASEKALDFAAEKVEALRTIVSNQAPHTDFCTAIIPPHACNCWRGEFMAELDRMPEEVTPAPEPCQFTHETPTFADCLRCGQGRCHLRYGNPNGQPYTVKTTIA